jgi:hypothetical protein
MAIKSKGSQKSVIGWMTKNYLELLRTSKAEDKAVDPGCFFSR